jgi:hypothetical protein
MDGARDVFAAIGPTNAKFVVGEQTVVAVPIFPIPPSARGGLRAA